MTEVYQYKPTTPIDGNWNITTLPYIPDAPYGDYYKIDEAKKALDIQIGGSHYKTGIQPWEYIEANNLDFFEGNVIKYVTRKKGNRLEDLEKARHYIDYLIEREKDGKLPKTP